MKSFEDIQKRDLISRSFNPSVQYQSGIFQPSQVNQAGNITTGSPRVTIIYLMTVKEQGVGLYDL